MEFSKVVKPAVIVGVLIAGWIMDGSWQGAVAWGIIMGFLWFMWEVIHYDPFAKQPPKIPTEQDFTDEPQKAIRGKRNPDSTRPTTDDFLGMATEYINRKRGM